MKNLMKKMKLNWKKKPKWFKILAFFLLATFLLEMILRFGLGLGDYPIYRKDSNYEYFYAPNQDVYRYGNHITTNELGMRSKSIDKNKKVKILEFGDSVLNGGAHVDQDKLSTTLQEELLNKQYDNQVQVLNVSAQSWGLSNAFAFFKKHGDFNSKIIVLAFSSHDLNDNMHFRSVVGVEPAWPSQKPLLAITDVWSRFLWPKLKSIFTDYDEYSYLKGFDDSKVNPGWKNFFSYTHKNNISIIVYLHATKQEVSLQEYDVRGQKILKICKKNNVKVIQDINQLKGQENAYIDNIHLNEFGHKIMTDLLVPELKLILEEKVL